MTNEEVFSFQEQKKKKEAGSIGEQKPHITSWQRADVQTSETKRMKQRERDGADGQTASRK